ncbi:MAG TPA: PaaI family thioesterase [Clostridia bacterium]|nr:PaaI family thioesterase [Clostridia bacterium]
MENNYIDTVKQNFCADRLPNMLGIELLELSEGKAVVQMRVKEEHLNLLGTTHGGAIFTLADTVMGLAANSRKERVSVTLNVHINYLRTTKAGEILTAVATEENLTRKTGVYSVRISDSTGALVALASGTCYVLTGKKEHKS